MNGLTAQTKTTIGAAASVCIALLTSALWIENSLDTARDTQRDALVPVVREQIEMRAEMKARFDIVEYRLRALEEAEKKK